MLVMNTQLVQCLIFWCPRFDWAIGPQHPIAAIVISCSFNQRHWCRPTKKFSQKRDCWV